MTDIQTRQLEAQASDIRDDIVTYERKLIDIKADIEKMRSEQFALEGHIETTNANLASASQDLEDLKAQKADLGSQITLLENSKVGIQNEIASLTNELNSIKTKFSEAAQKAQTESEVSITKSQQAEKEALELLAAAGSELNTARANLAVTKEQNTSLVTENEAIASEIEAKKAELPGIVSSIELLKKEHADLLVKFAEEKATLQSENKELTNINTQIKIDTAAAKAELEQVTKETFTLGEVSKKLDAREKEVNAREARVVELYEKAGVPLPQ